MKWFEHDTDAHMNQRLRDARAIFGAEGYGAFWIVQELIAGAMHPAKPEYALIRMPIKELAATCGISSQKLKKLALFFSTFDQKHDREPIWNRVEMDGKFIEIECCKLLRRADNYFKKAKK
jgi:hypothetical protein